MKEVSDKQLEEQHTGSAIAERLDNPQQHDDLGDIMLGAVDGTVTTFAIVSGVAGTGLEQGVAVAFVLGLANVIADGFSMGASNLLKARSDLELLAHYRKVEEMHIERVPDSEREEIRQIYSRKGFSGDLLESIVETICSDKKRWVDTMLADEWGLQTNPSSPWRAALLTFGAFLLAGFVPLLPLLFGVFSTITSAQIFLYSALLTALCFLCTGALRGWVLQRSLVISALETLAVGGVAAIIAYGLGHALGAIFL